MLHIQAEPLDPAPVRAAVEDPGFGAVILFEGVVRDHFEGRRVRGLEYECYPPMALRVLEQIRDEVQARWPGVRLAVVHRVGALSIGERAVIVATGAGHRGACYEANRYAMEQLKARVPIWKKELYEDGASWIANSP